MTIDAAFPIMLTIIYIERGSNRRLFMIRRQMVYCP